MDKIEDDIYRKSFQSSIVGHLLLQRTNGEFIVIDANPLSQQAGQWKHHSSESIVGQAVTSAFPGSKESGIWQIFHEVLQIQETIRLGEFEYEDLEVPRGVFDITLSPLDEAHILISFTNITQQKQMAAQLEEYNEQLLTTKEKLEEALLELQQIQQKIMYSERMNALGEMVSGIAHDFNNALLPIQGFIELMLYVNPSHLENPETVKRYLQLMAKSAEDAAQVVKRLKAFSRKERQHFKSINLAKLVEEAKLLSRPKWKQQAQRQGKTIEIICNIAKEVPNVVGCESELYELCLNLISNAVDAISDKGQITIDVFSDGKNVFLKVADDGCGMSKEARSRCFTPFFSTKKGKRGAGLGLPIVHGIVQRHQGRIDIESTPGQGTVFTICLPQEEKSHSSSKWSVLIVNEEELNRQLLGEIIASGGHTVALAANAQEALELLREHSFDLIIADLAMQKMKGDALSALVKENYPNVKIIMLTGFGNDVRDAPPLPYIDVMLSKPVDHKNLYQALNEVMMSSSPL